MCIFNFFNKLRFEYRNIEIIINNVSHAQFGIKYIAKPKHLSSRIKKIFEILN